MKKLFYAMLVVLCCCCMSCNSDEVLNYVPATSDVVLVLKADKSSDRPEAAEMDNYLKTLEETANLKLTDQQKSFIKEIAVNPKSAGIDYSKKMCAYIDYELAADMEKCAIGMCIPLRNRQDFENTLKGFGNICKDNLGKDFTQSIKTQDALSYIQITETAIVGWNDDVCLLLAKESAVTPSDLLSICSMDKSASILSNDDFCDFNKDCKNINMWASSDFMGTPEFKKMLDSNCTFPDEDAHLITDLLAATNIQLEGNYLHCYVDIEDDEYTLTIKFIPNESLQNADAMNLTNAIQRTIKQYNEMQMEYWNNKYGMASDTLSTELDTLALQEMYNIE